MVTMEIYDAPFLPFVFFSKETEPHLIHTLWIPRHHQNHNESKRQADMYTEARCTDHCQLLR